MRKKTKHLDFDINLIPFIDLLSTCICFLLLTAVWIQIGSMNVKQAVGGQAAENEAKKPTVWVQMAQSGDLTLNVRDSHVPARLAKMRIAGIAGKPNLATLGHAVDQLKTAEPLLTTALLQPTSGSMYEDIIDVMDQFKKSGVVNLGVSPL